MTQGASDRFVDPDGGGSVRRYLGLDRSEVPDGDAGWMLVGRAPIGDHVRGPAGPLRTGALLAMIDSVGGFAGGLAALPDWIVTTSIALRVGRSPDIGPVRLEPRVLRRGRNSVVTEVAVFDEGATGPDERATTPGPVATAIVTCAVLTPTSGPPQLTRPVRIPAPQPFDAPEPYERFLRVHPDGRGPETGPAHGPAHGPDARGPASTLSAPTWLDVEPHLRNRWGILHGGVVAALVDIAAVRAAGGGVSTDVVLHFLSPAKVGPVEARPDVIGIRADGTLVQVSVQDAGPGGGGGGRRVATASVTVRPC